MQCAPGTPPTFRHPITCIHVPGYIYRPEPCQNLIPMSSCIRRRCCRSHLQVPVLEELVSVEYCFIGPKGDHCFPAPSIYGSISAYHCLHCIHFTPCLRACGMAGSMLHISLKQYSFVCQCKPYFMKCIISLPGMQPELLLPESMQSEKLAFGLSEG